MRRDGWQNKRREIKGGKEREKNGRSGRVLLSGEVLEPAALLDDGLGKLLEDSVHVGALSGPQALQEANVAAVAGDEQGQVGILLHGLHWNGCKG